MQGKPWVRSVLCVLVMSFVAHMTASETVLSAASPLPTSAVAPTISISSSQNAQMWNLKNADIRAVIQTIAVLTGKSFIVDPRVQGNVTLISQKPMTPDELYQVFLSMLQILQFAAVPSGNVIKVVPAMNAAALSRQIATNANPGSGDEIVVRVVPVNHVSATELVPVLRPLMSQSGSVTAYMPSNALILAGSASNITRLIKVIRSMDMVNSNQVTVVHLNYANAKNVVSVIQSLQSARRASGGTSNTALAADSDENSILVSANTTNTLIIENLIRQLDRKGSGADDTRVVSLNYLSAKKLAPILAKIAEGINASAKTAKGNAASDDSQTNDNISVQAESNTNAIIMHASIGVLNGLTSVIRRLDRRPQEVLVEAIIVKVDEDLLNKLGIVWGTANNNPTGSTTSSSSTPNGASVTTTSPTPASSISDIIGTHNTLATQFDHGVGFLPGQNLTTILHLLKSNGESDVLSTPSVVVLNNSKAMISDGQNIGMANRSYQGTSPATTGGATESIVAPYNTIQRSDVALSLEVTPQISPNHMIQLALLQKDDSLAPGGNSNNENPTINTSKIQTSVLVKSGSILVLGGLISNEDEKTHQKIPILGDIPLLGRLFRYDTHDIKKTNLMVFIRPIIMSGDLARQQTLNHYDYLREEQIKAETQQVKQNDIPLLPQLNAEKHVDLPLPVQSMNLPMPVTT